MGVPEVHRRHRRRRCYWHQGRSPAYGEGISFWALGEMVREPGRAAGARRRGDDAQPRSPPRSASTSRTRHERRWIEPALLAAAGRGRSAARRARGAVRRVAHVLRAHRRARARRCWCSRTSSGPMRACSTSSSTCSNGPRPSRSSSSRWPARSCSSDGPTGARASATSPRSSLEPLPDEVMRELLAGLVPGLPEQAVARRSWRAPRASRCTRSRRCGCCCSDGRLEKRDGVYGRSATCGTWRCPRPCMR